MGTVTSYTKTRIDEIIAASVVSGAVSGMELVLSKGDGSTIRIPLPSGVTQADIDQAINNLIDFSPETLNTLNEISVALGNDPNFATTITNMINQRTTEAQVIALIDQNAGGSFKQVTTGLILGFLAGGQPNYLFIEAINQVHRGISSLIRITPSSANAFGIGPWDLQIRNASNGDLFLEALDISGTFEIFAPIYLEGDAQGDLWVGIRNRSPVTATFTLDLRMERFA